MSRAKESSRFDEPIPTPSSSSYSAYKKRVERQRLSGKNKAHFIFGAFHRKTGEMVGQVDLYTINEELRWGNLGYHVQNQHWGCGFATEACHLALDIAFGDLNFHRIEASTDVRNKASIRVAKKIGLIFEGRRRKFFPENGGVDMEVYAMNSIDYL